MNVSIQKSAPGSVRAVLSALKAAALAERAAEAEPQGPAPTPRPPEAEASADEPMSPLEFKRMLRERGAVVIDGPGADPTGRRVTVPLPDAKPRQRKPRPAAIVDELRRFWPDRPGMYFSAGPRGIAGADPIDPAALEPFNTADRAPRDRPPVVSVKPPRSAPRGPAEILAYLEGRGIRVIPTGDGNVAVLASGARLDVASRDAINAALPLLRAYLHGTPLRCALPNHDEAEPPEAVTLVLGGAPACEECAPRTKNVYGAA